MKNQNIKNIILTLVFGVCLALFIISFSIAFPILFRPFYYLQINHIIDVGQNYYWKPEWNYAAIKTGYDEVLDFCCFPWVKNFSAGIFGFSESGASHFEDCKGLFLLDFIVLFFSFDGLVALTILNKLKKFEFKKLLKRSVFFWTSVSIIVIFLIIFVAILIVGFDNAFTTFHHLFFPGKGNWIFEYDVDEIINVLPEEFFMNCAICIGSLIAASCLCGIIFDFIKIKKIKQ